MKIDIHFYLESESGEESEDTKITSFYDLDHNPFEDHDTITLEIDGVHPLGYGFVDDESEVKRIEENKKLSNAFNNRKIKIFAKKENLRFNITCKPKLTIDYYCIFLEDYYEIG